MITMKKFVRFDDGSINPFPALEETIDKIDYDKIISYIHSPCWNNLLWTTKFYDEQDNEISEEVLQFLQNNGYEGNLNGEQKNHLRITLSMRKYRLSRKGKIGGGYSLETPIHDINMEHDKIMDYMEGCPLPGNWTTRFVVVKERVWDEKRLVDPLDMVDVTDIVTKYLQKTNTSRIRGEVPCEL